MQCFLTKLLVKMSKNLLNAKNKLMAITHVSKTFIYDDKFEKGKEIQTWVTKKSAFAKYEEF